MAKRSRQQGSRQTKHKRIPKAGGKASLGRSSGAPRLRAHKRLGARKQQTLHAHTFSEKALRGETWQGKRDCEGEVQKKKRKTGRHALGSRIGERARQREEAQRAHNLHTDRLRFAAEDDRSNLVALLHAARGDARKTERTATEQTQEDTEQKGAMQQLRHLHSVQAGLAHCARARLPLVRVCGPRGNVEELAELRCAAAAVKALTLNSCQKLKLGASDTHLVLGTALRIVEFLLDPAEGLPRHALAAQLRLYRSSPISLWALAVFQTTLAVGPQRELTDHEWGDVRSRVPDNGLRQVAKIQCCMLNTIYMAPA